MTKWWAFFYFSIGYSLFHRKASPREIFDILSSCLRALVARRICVPPSTLPGCAVSPSSGGKADGLGTWRQSSRGDLCPQARTARAACSATCGLFSIGAKSHVLRVAGRAGRGCLKHGQIKLPSGLLIGFRLFRCGRGFVGLISFFAPATYLGEHFTFTRFHRSILTPSG